MKLYLPRTLDAADILEAVDTTPFSGGTETILVAEDDDEVRNTVVELLSALGYRVLTARDAASALTVIESGAPIDLLFTDVVMPGPLRSPELARMARQRLPSLAVLFTSGYTLAWNCWASPTPMKRWHARSASCWATAGNRLPRPSPPRVEGGPSVRCAPRALAASSCLRAAPAGWRRCAAHRGG